MESESIHYRSPVHGPRGGHDPLLNALPASRSLLGSKGALGALGHLRQHSSLPEILESGNPGIFRVSETRSLIGG